MTGEQSEFAGLIQQILARPHARMLEDREAEKKYRRLDDKGIFWDR